MTTNLNAGGRYISKCYATSSAVTVSNTVLAIANVAFGWSNSAIPDAALFAHISVLDQPVMITFDGETDPTTTRGLRIPANTVLQMEGNENIKNLRMIRQGGSDATVTVILERLEVY